VGGLVEIIFGVVAIITGAILRLPCVVRWMEEDIDARLPQTPLRKIRALEGILNWHYRTSRKWAPLVIGPFFVMVGIGMIVVGIAEIT